MQGLYGNSTKPASLFGSNAAAAWDAGFMGNSSVHVGIIDQGVQVSCTRLHSCSILGQVLV
jgi:hypothetical protein